MPNVNVDEFSCLLTFMYTGYLDLNLSNIYNILLATHILHMPRALEICRNFLLQSHPLESQSRGGVIKPIPNRKIANPYPQIFPPAYTYFQKSEATPFRTIGVDKPEEKASTSAKGSENLEDCTTHLQKSPPKRESNPEKANSKLKRPNNPSDATKDKTIVDIACCDGPVRFHRVINKNYGLPIVENDYKIHQINRNDVMNKVMNENIRDKQLSDENQANNDVFTCLYCNHTFKSQYCYQKHARRHLNPVSIDGKGVQVESAGSCKREVKLLDMNVQYYPCKTCGSKFPSYYFVHKHRKMCHTEDIGENGKKEGNGVEESTNSNHGADSSKDSTIDVEEINQ